MKIEWSLLQKYNQPVPRYTSYPTVPYWQPAIDAEKWESLVQEQFKIRNSEEGISLYIHLPFCESLCTYCGCNKKITTNHSVEEIYIDALLKEWQLYRELMHEKPVLKELHLGGGTPTFFSAGNLQKMLTQILEDCTIHPQRAFSIEGHPNNTTREHLETLYQFGFRRISFGVQDNDPTVQKVINRIQPFSTLQTVTNMARTIGFTSINFDLIYGLPLQTLQSMRTTITQCVSLKPDRVAFYSYAHVPWTSRGQRLFSERDLPTTDLKMQLYLLGKEMFLENGYSDIGMDHFSLKEDDLYQAKKAGKLHRNFMGYTTQQGGLLIGLGVSAISDIGVAYAQNKKTLHDYYKHIKQEKLAIEKGHFLSAEDMDFKQYILDLICTGKTVLEKKHQFLLKDFVLPALKNLEEDGLVEMFENAVFVTPAGSNFLRNICAAFDLYLQRNQPDASVPMFSKAV